MVWYFHLVEECDDHWVCQHGVRPIDKHSNLAEALQHLHALASSKTPSSIVLHLRNGTVRMLNRHGGDGPTSL
ncbi:hypothetical protein [Smaragdicoccus niigatensis]|uniref:hypothetical protein n=1 Tax=Smaragdicoccus niigatensis TaxID=359359 RepID=UPI0003715058|nr:hypothetical protein [Smaragdicoccus niigatensis]